MIKRCRNCGTTLIAPGFRDGRSWCVDCWRAWWRGVVEGIGWTAGAALLAWLLSMLGR